MALRHATGLLLLLLLSCSSGSSGGGGSSGGLPAGWTTKDVGAVGVAGSASYAGGVFKIGGSGADIWALADAFRFLYRALSGDGEISVRVLSLDNTDPWAKAGVMIRDSLDPGSAYAMTVVTPGNGVSFQSRAAAGQGCALDWGPGVPAPTWLRIKRTGNTITGYQSADGASWTPIASRAIPMGATVYIGLCVTAHNNTKTAYASFDSLGGSGAIAGGFDPAKLGPDMYLLSVGVYDGMHGTWAGVYVQVIDPAAVSASNHAPQVDTVTATPSTVAPFGKLTLSVSASDADGDALRRVWILPAGETSGDTWTAPSQPGTYTLRVLVSDGQVWSSGSVNVTVSGAQGTNGVGNHAAAIRSFTASAVTVTQGTAVQLAVDAADVEGDPLSYAWASNGGGSISGSGPTATWIAPAPGSGRPAKAGLWIWPRYKPAGCPFELSTDIPGIAFVGRAAVQHFCDTWMPAWAADGNLYSPWQDGVLLTPPFANMGGWHAGDSPAKNGWAKIHGNDPQDLLIPKAGEIAGPRGSFNGRYPGAVFHHNGVIYYGVRSTTTYDNAGNQTKNPDAIYRWAGGPFHGFHTSSNDGDSWTSPPHPDTPLFPEPTAGGQRLKFGEPYLVDFGKNQERSPDGKVYFVSAGGVGTDASTDNLNDDRVFLCRVTPSVANINDLSKYEFYAGGGTWSSNLQAAQPLWVWKNMVSGASVVWNPGLNKFIMSVYHDGYTTNGVKTEFADFESYVLEADHLTGPYRLVHFFPSFGTQAYYPNIPSKFISADGRDAWFWYGANFMPFDRASDPPGSGYRLCAQRIRFLTAADTP